jgi:hypothetical protein
MKKKHFVVVGGTLLLIGLITRELGFVTVERFSESAVRYTLVKSSGRKLPGPYSSIVVRPDSLRVEDKDIRAPETLYMYVDGFVIDRSLGCFVPLYKNGVSASYLRFEFVLDEKTYGGGIVSMKSESRILGLRSARAGAEQEFNVLVETIIKYHGEGGVSFTYSDRTIGKKTEPNKAMEPIPVDVTIPAAQEAAPSTSMAHL